ncbi:MAG: glycosyl transferase [Clostridia bacterium]|nr:glycosyl transferase [Clostridia bacterium]
MVFTYKRARDVFKKSNTPAVKDDAAGYIGEHGEHVIRLHGTSVDIGPHFDVNLLLGNRVGYPSPLISTPKAALDAFGRGSFRADASRQVLATRFDLRFEHNGEPTNRQFYIYEDGKQIFYSAKIEDGTDAVCRHYPNRTVIEYEFDGLKVTRTIFIVPQEDDMPEAVEAQIVSVENLGKDARTLKFMFTGTFGLCSPESMTNDIVYATVTHEGGVLEKDGKVWAVAPSSFPKHLKWQKRFASIFSDGEPMDEFCESYTEFFGAGTLEKPERAAHLSSQIPTKDVSFFAMAKTVTVGAGEIKFIDEFVGFTPDRTPDLSDFDRKIGNFVTKYKNHENTASALEKVIKFIDDYSSYIKISSKDEEFNRYVNHDLPFQVLYQSFVSRSFAWTQKAFREIGFREIQDMYASVYYMCAMGNAALAKDMISKWAQNVYKMGYANHNFYDSGKEPGVCSDDGLWLVQAVYRYVSLTGDTSFLDEKYPMADGGERSIYDTMAAVVTYSGKISVGEHGFPLMDKADWNDTMKLDDDHINGKEKEALYYKQLEEKHQEYGARFESRYSESVMNAFLLKIALDELSEMAQKTHRDGFEKESAVLSENLRKYAWRGDFYARAMIGGEREYKFLGAAGDGLSADENIDGTYFLNSFSWSILSGVADEDQIKTMLCRVKEYLWTDAGLKLCTPASLEKLASGTAAGHYYPGDRENGGVFKHAAMMAVVAMLKAAKTVNNIYLAEELADLAYKMIDKTLPYKALENPCVYKGNPRFCTQYNNSFSGEHCGPMLSGTASWLSLAVFEMLGIEYSSSGISLSPVLPSDWVNSVYIVNCAGTEFEIEVEKPSGFAREDDKTEYYLDGASVAALKNIIPDGKKHKIKIIFK